MSDDASPAPNTTTVTAVWAGDQRFAVSSVRGGAITIDIDRVAGTGPVDTLLGALAACSASDVLEILAKRRTPAERLAIVVRGERRAQPPRRLVRAELEFRIDGAGIEAVHAERAIALSVDKYCSVATSLAPDIALSSVLVLNGERHAPQPRSAVAPPG
ncbi:MAG TPA: OsmC family protein [Gemmatimonadaceae bacterium]|nr:OsmC family protein [Gemmatimonadaceae bacterium]